MKREGRERRLAIYLAALIFVIAFPFIDKTLGLGLLGKTIPVALFIILALGLNVVVGFAGLLDLGYAAFFAIGAYTVGFLTSQASKLPYHELDFWPAMIVAALVAGIFGVILGAPTLRLRGDYLAIVTLGFGEIVPLVIRNTPDVTYGILGISPIGTPQFALGDAKFRFGIDSLPWYYLIIAIAALSIFLTTRLRDARIGRAWMAMREDEVAAASMGVNLVTTKLFAFSLGASFSGFAGAIWAGYLQQISPEQFDFSVSVFVLCMIILGGIGNIWGVVLGGIILGSFDRVLAEKISGGVHGLGDLLGINALSTFDVVQFKFAILGIALVVLMNVRPEGLFPSRRRKAELHAGDDSIVEEHQAHETLYDKGRT
ncbi:MAG: branched-chain amino acid ABC transporter permease [Chloroflexi bacterium]|nr:branched-chain amino acid ABC transporter permease [Chloroflexota bacterium]